MKTIYQFIISIFLIPISVYGQSITPQVISSSGDSNLNSSFQLDWTIGEIAIETYSNYQYTLSQGFHQSDLKITSIYTNPIISFNCKVFPNPVTDILSLKTDFNDLKKMQYIITDVNGKTKLKSIISTPLQKIDIESFIVGTYFLNVYFDQKKIQTFKIIKTN